MGSAGRLYGGLHLCRSWHGAGKYELGGNRNGKGPGGVEVSRVANSYWVDERIRTQHVSPRTNSLASVQQISLDIIGTRTEVRRRGGVIPSWVVFGMILLATLAVCVTVNMRTHAKVHVAAQQLTVMPVSYTHLTLPTTSRV